MPAKRAPKNEGGRPRLKGGRLPNLSEVTEDPNTFWKPTVIANRYEIEERMVEVASATAVWLPNAATCTLSSRV